VDSEDTTGVAEGAGVRWRRLAGNTRSALRVVTRTAARATTRATRTTGNASARAARTTRRTIRQATHAQGAGESGLAKLIELHAVNAAGDMLIAISLAGTLFFSVPAGEARGNVALYLLVTMAPFVVMAPLIGPLLDRVRHGRRYALAATMLARGFLAWEMATAVADNSPWLYAAAFGVLVSSKAYGVTRSAATPRLLPSSVSLVKANSRISLAGIVAAGVAAPVGGGLAYLGPEWSLRATAVVFVLGMVLALRLPRRVDSAEGEHTAVLSSGPALRQPRSTLRRVGPAVMNGLKVSGALRAFSGFLTMFLAFLLREEPLGGLSEMTAIGAVAGAAGVGAVIGTSLGALLRDRAPEAIVVSVLALEAAVVLVAVIWYGLPAVLAAGFVAGFAQTLSKLSLDALIQRDTPEDVRTSAFARSETVLQLAWVAGGGLGILLPLRGEFGLGIAFAGLLAMLVVVARAASHRRDQGVSRSFPPDASGGKLRETP
jgi:MFS family permease